MIGGVENTMYKDLIYLSLLIWGGMLLLTFVVYVFEFYKIIETNMIPPIRIILIVIEVVAFVIGCLGILLQEKHT
jgi:hypothetical protein